MKTKVVFQALCSLILSAIFLISCEKKSNNNNNSSEDEVLYHVSDTLFSQDYYAVLHTEKYKNIQVGYNNFAFLIYKNNGEAVYADTVIWSAEMNMTGMKHGCPSSILIRDTAKVAFWTGFQIFQMASNASEFWNLKLMATIDGADIIFTKNINVEDAPNRSVEVFSGLDSKRYVLAWQMIELPKVGINTMNARLYRMESMMSFAPVNNYYIKIDPRMPSMENHSSPNNESLISIGNGIYEGKLNFSMTGYWRINLQVLNDRNEIVKGEEINDSISQSSLYFDIAL